MPATPDNADSAKEPVTQTLTAEKKQNHDDEKHGLASITGGLLSGLASQAAILTAVLVYFGWVRVQATYRYFGVDASALSFSVSDYVLRSVDAAFPILVVVGLIGTAAMVGHGQVRPKLEDENGNLKVHLLTRAAWTGVVLILAGFILALALTGPNGSYIWGPALLLIGSAVTTYSLAVLNGRTPTGWTRFLAVTAAMTLVGFLWTVAAYAGYAGTQKADQVISELPTAPDVTVYSVGNLLLAGPGISASTIQAPQSPYHFRYDGLRLLVSSGGQYFLLPSRWRQGDGPVIALPVTDPGILVEFTLTKAPRAG